ncbi:hypothetical protein [Arthrobacter gengyunqii]|uniref:TOBE domain-containing protein n=1 Tax=Arthrobacter gengyunqii TaxID=2886940 RepID=A0ABS8GDT1_9MICC|nr:hypothetical protein [Arthrobacter gengyunqii]MCC3264764.1 hypothetical protein [Arthrobacter gengyunqii]
MVVRVDGRRPPMKGATLYVRPQQGHVHLFDAANGERLGGPRLILPLNMRWPLRLI